MHGNCQFLWFQFSRPVRKRADSRAALVPTNIAPSQIIGYDEQNVRAFEFLGRLGRIGHQAEKVCRNNRHTIFEAARHLFGSSKGEAGQLHYRNEPDVQLLRWLGSRGPCPAYPVYQSW